MRFSSTAKPAPTANPEMAVSTMKPTRFRRSSQIKYSALANSSINGAPDLAQTSGETTPDLYTAVFSA